MSNAPTDFYHHKTDAELQFFVEHPDYYQPALVEEALRELRRRGVAPNLPALVETSIPDLPAPSPVAFGLQTGPLVLVVAGVLALCLGVLYFMRHKDRPAPPPVAAAKPVRKGPPQLTEVAISVIPDFGPVVLTSVQRQVQRIPAAERGSAAKASMPMHQYRELAKRFWTAEAQTEYLLSQARSGHQDAALAGHVESVQTTWQQWNKATLYSYKFGPVMSSHLDIMSRVARQQQEGLADLLLVANNPQTYENAKTRQRTADVDDLLAGLLPKSPVTGQAYAHIVRRVRLTP